MASDFEGDVAHPRALLAPCLLLLLAEAPGHGYELMERLKPLGFDWGGPGPIYRELRALEEPVLTPHLDMRHAQQRMFVEVVARGVELGALRTPLPNAAFRNEGGLALGTQVGTAASPLESMYSSWRRSRTT